MIKVIFVCTGNTCRSPMAEHILKHKLKQKGISLKDVCVTSTGIFANEREFVEPNAVKALKNLNINVNAKQKAKQIKKSQINKNTIIITVTEEHKKFLSNLDNVISLSELNSGISIPDPYGYPFEVYQQVAKILNFILDEVVEIIINKLENLK